MTPEQRVVIEQSLQSSFHEMQDDLKDERLFELHAQTCYCTATGRTDHGHAADLVGLLVNRRSRSATSSFVSSFGSKTTMPGASRSSLTTAVW